MLRVLEATLLVALLGAAILAWRLSQGPITLNAIAPYVASLLNDLDPDLQFRIERAEFKWEGFSGSPELAARDVRVLDAAGNVVAGLPTMLVRLNSAALLKGEIAPQHVSLSNPILRFVHRANGTFGLGLEGVGGATSSAPAQGGGPRETSGNVLAATFLDALARGDENSAVGYLETLTIEDTTLMLVDEVSGQRWLAPDATLNFARDANGMQIEAALPVVEDGKAWQLTAKGAILAAERMLNLEINVDGVRPARLAVLAPQLSPLSMIDLQMSGVVSAGLALTEQGARISSVAFDVRGEQGFLRMPAPLSKDYSVKTIALRGAASDALDRITIDGFRMELDRGAAPSPVLTMTADARQLNSTPHVQLEADLDRLSIEDLKDYWPNAVKPNTHRWIANNLTDGYLDGVSLRMTLAGTSIADVDATDMSLTAALHDMTVTYLSQMPKVHDTEGRMALSLRDLRIDVSAGHVPDAYSGKGLRVPEATLRMVGLGTGTETADFDINIVGDFGDAMRLIDHQPLVYATKMNVDPLRATGTADVNLSLTFPLIAGLRLDQVTVGVEARTRGIGLADVAFGQPLTDGDMDLVLDEEGMDVRGTALLGGIATKVAWRENFRGGDFRSRYVLDPIVSNQQRPMLGLSTMPFIPPYIDGNVAANVVYTVYRDQTRYVEADVDLTAPTMSIPELSWTKEAGVPARGKVVARFIGDRLDSVPSFLVTSGDDLKIEGSAKFGAERAMTSLTIMPSAAGRSRLSLNIERVGEGYRIEARGSAFNATNFLREINRPNPDRDPASPPTPMIVDAKFDRMWLAENDDFRDVSLHFERTSAGVQALDFDGAVNGTVPVSLVLENRDGKRVFEGESADGGAVVRALGLFRDIGGGRLDVGGEMAPDGTMRGLAEIKDFQLREAPVLARLLSVAALTGILDELRGDGISFSTLRLPFSYADSQLTIEDGEMFGSSLGLTAKGTYDFPSSSMDVTGTLIPAYAINAALNSIPLLGDLLTGGDKGSGIFAATYSYRGPIATAEPSVNPLAALAPGFLRRIFDIFSSSSRQQTARMPPAPSPQAETN